MSLKDLANRYERGALMEVGRTLSQVIAHREATCAFCNAMPLRCAVGENLQVIAQRVTQARCDVRGVKRLPSEEGT